MWVIQSSSAVHAVVEIADSASRQHRGTEAVPLLLVTITTGAYRSVLCQNIETHSQLLLQHNVILTSTNDDMFYLVFTCLLAA